MKARTLITGVGMATPHGIGVADSWAATRVGKNAIGRITRFDPSPYPSRLAGEIRDFDPRDHLPDRLVRQTDRSSQLALTAAAHAFGDAGVRPADVPEYGGGVVTAAGFGGIEFGQNELRNLWSRGSRYVSVYQSFAWFHAATSGQISVRHELRGHAGVLVGDQAGGLDALAQARRRIRRGSRLIVSGGVDASLCSWGWAAHLATGQISAGEHPERSYLPFDRAADGHVPGEGGALLILEDERAAIERGADNVYCEIAGYASTFDPRPGDGREPGLRRAIELALADAALGAWEIDLVFADAAATARMDREEAEALIAVFGAFAVPVTAPKTAIGRLCGGGAPVDVVMAALAIREGLIPPTVHVEPSPEYDIDLVTTHPRPASVRTALVIARGHGGFNSAMVVRAVD
ncbi:ketosynthase chain-length factor [Streptomyces mutabilis]|uniref:Beta-ketoacyl synthase n=1 Tax=Streptomyces mutabilis TaxID=67332 RepID=A0A086MRT8_9ACTN|nr:ketosynthase chain-length factor [Streptomyces mutabilis]KFG71606.1 beta-ketoacyl synthase [Streptomyces mutabilis]